MFLVTAAAHEKSTACDFLPPCKWVTLKVRYP